MEYPQRPSGKKMSSFNALGLQLLFKEKRNIMKDNIYPRKGVVEYKCRHL